MARKTNYKSARFEKRNKIMISLLSAAAIVIIAVMGTNWIGSLSNGADPATAGGLSVKVSGNKFVDQAGKTLQLQGVNRSGTQYACAEGWGFFDGPSDNASIDNMKKWGINAVRVNGNEACWLGINGVKAAYGGAKYQAAIGAYVKRLNAKGLYVIFDLHHSAPGTQQARDQQPMADRDHSPAFWKSVANYFKSNPAVIFDLYNEPYPDNNRNTTAAWKCVRDGGLCPGVGFVAAGMQELVNAVRSTGAKNPILVSGPQYAGVVNRWLEFKPNDPANQLAASVHVYAKPLGSPYDHSSTWNAGMGALAKKVPLVMGEIGDTDCTHKFIDKLMPWADARKISYFGWGWVVGNCREEPSLIKNFNGTPSKYGAGLRSHLLK